MAKPGLYPWKKPFLRLHVFEWALVLVVILVMVLVFGYKLQSEAHSVRGQAELAGVKSTLGALRTAFVIDHLHAHVAGNTPATVVQINPFQLLERLPANYFGDISVGDAATIPGGSWAFDPVCVCVGYRPINPEWFDSPSGDAMAWYRVEGAPGPLQLTAKEAYVWQGEALN